MDFLVKLLLVKKVRSWVQVPPKNHLIWHNLRLFWQSKANQGDGSWGLRFYFAFTSKNSAL